MTGNNNNSPWDPNNQQGHNPGYAQNQQPGYQNSHYPQGAPGYGGQPPAGYEPYPYGQPKNSNKMPIIIAVVVVALIAIGALVFFLLNGNGDDEADDRDQPTTEETIGEDPETEDPFTDPETEDPIETDDPIETEDPVQQYGDPNADPARFRAGMEDILADTGLTQEAAEAQGITAQQWDTYLTCVTDESLQRLTPEVIETISGGQDVYDSHSVSELGDIAMQCGEEAGTL